jgi:RNase H-like domain found in reverse transcriptase/Reverse transcriptase (RNA-dependent DNA polymerase)/Integrase zinc binding domain/Chromo (CHRromatin Organisation MOdifier) domain
MGKKARILIDTGCLGNFISPEFVRRHSLHYTKKKRSYTLVAFDDQPVDSNGGKVTHETLPYKVSVGPHDEEVIFDITVTSSYDAVFGLPWLEKHNPTIGFRTRTIRFNGCGCMGRKERTKIVPVSLNAMGAYWKQDPDSVVFATIKVGNEGDVEIPSEYANFAKLFKEPAGLDALPKHQPWDHKIDLIPGTKLPPAFPIYSLSEKELAVLRDFIKIQLAKGYIRPSKSPVRFPILFVPKKGGELRLCVDYRKLNDITIKNRYTLPLAEEIQSRIRGAKWFTKIDLREAYHKVRIAEGEEWKTAWGCRFGHYEQTVVNFGLTNAPATFQALINDILRENLDMFVTAYLDDILIYSKTKQEHIQHVTWVLERLEQHGMRIRGDKCAFHQQEVEYLGFILTTEGIRMDPKKVEAVTTWPEPTNVTEIQEFMGFANFYRRFIKGYSGITTPLTDLTKKEKAWAWTENEQFAFDELKRRFTTAPILALFNPETEIVVETDASDYAIGACLSQKDTDGRLHPVAFYSRKMSPAEKNYDIHDKELLAIVMAFQEWRVYLEGPKYEVKVFTDHKNLTWFTTTKVLNRRQVRWAETLASYNFSIHYQKGSENGRADALSRRADHRVGNKHQAYTILMEDSDGTLRYNHRKETNSLTIRNEDWEKRVKEAYKEDPMARIVMNKPPSNSRIQVKEGIILMEGLIYVPQSLRKEVFEQYHIAKAMGHQGTDRTLEKMQRTYYFPAMRDFIDKETKKCGDCQRNKSSRHKPYGFMKSPTAPVGAWQSIAMDFIVKLPKSKEPMTQKEYDSILVVTDRLTKYGYFIPYLEESTAEDLAYMFMKHIIANHGIPEEIISDRDKLFTSKFWKSLMDQIGIHHKLSTAYHPQTDGQTERLNQTLEQYLRFYLDYDQKNWVTLLPVAQLAWNSAAASLTGISPFYANYGLHPNVAGEPRGLVGLADKAKVKVDDIKDMHKKLSYDIEWLSQRTAHYYNKRRLEGPRLTVGDKVWLLRRNIKTTRPSDKLDHKKFGPFEIVRNIKGIAYELKLPTTMKIHPVFHISLLEPASPEVPEGPAPILEEGMTEAEYEVEKIVDVVERRNRLLWLVKWKGYGNEENTWEPKENLKNCSAVLECFYSARPKKTPGRDQWDSPRKRPESQE